MSTQHADPPAEEALSTAVYVYGVGRASTARGGGSGVVGARVEPVVHRSLAALTSRVTPPVRARRRDLLLHSEVLQTAFETDTVLPLRFGTVFASEADVVSDLLEPRHDELERLLLRLDGRVELSVRAFFREEAVLAEIVRSTPRIARLRTAAQEHGPSHPLQVQLGEAVAAELDRRRRAAADEIVAALVPLANDVVVQEHRAAMEVVRAAFLVERARVDAFDERMNDLAREREPEILFKYTGPLPPHSFVSAVGAG